MHPHEYEGLKPAAQPEPFALLTEAEAAKRLSVSQRTLQRLVYRGSGPPRVQLGKRVAYPLDGLIAWARQRTVTSEAA
jgi:predicted DNA-binding transcriptional regulator AlpA